MRVPHSIFAGVAGAALMCACNMADTKGGATETANDLFPKPLGVAILPLEQEFWSTFRYVEFDAAGAVFMRQDLRLRVVPKAGKLYGYSFEDTSRGTLLAFRDFGGNRDSAGIYIVGHFHDSVMVLDSQEVLWLPQVPKANTSWFTEPGRKNELAAMDTAIWTDVLFPYENDPAAPVRHGFQRQPTVLFKETMGDTLTYYHFRRGVGCVAFERSVAGKLLATGTIHTFYGKYRYGPTYYGIE